MLLENEKRKIMDKIAVLIPCYNEAATIGKILERFYPKRPFTFMIIIQLMIPSKLPVKLEQLFVE